MSGVQMYRLHDVDPGANGGCVRIKPQDAKEWNDRGYGIFHTVNSFHGPRRASNLVLINAWAVDLDAGDKSAMLERIKAGLIPTMVVETKRGFHVYWAAKDAKPEHWNAIILDRLVPFYGADPRARDLCRILRSPGYYHRKDPSNPFLVQKVWEWPVAYTEQQMASFYPDNSQEVREEFIRSHQRSIGHSDDFWEKVWRLDCMDMLTRLSGHPAVGGETYSFRRVGNGNFNILVNGRGTSCWVDRDGRIGSLDKGGPSIYQWLTWFKHSHARAVEIIKEIAPEVL